MHIQDDPIAFSFSALAWGAYGIVCVDMCETSGMGLPLPYEELRTRRFDLRTTTRTRGDPNCVHAEHGQRVPAANVIIISARSCC